MPSAKNIRAKADPTTQIDHTVSDEQPKTAVDQSLFDEEHPAGKPIEETAAPIEPSADDSLEGVDGEQREETPAATLGEAAPVVPDPVPEGVTLQQPAIVPAEHDAPDEPHPDLPSNAERSSVGPKEVRLGLAIGQLHRMPLGDVLGTAEAFAEKIEVLRTSAAVQALLPRMRASEGRCAPVYFTMNEAGEPEHLLAGDDALSAAKALGLKEVFVVLFQPGDAGAVHAYLNGHMTGDHASTEDDDLVWRTDGYHSDS